MSGEIEMLCKDAFAISARLFDHKAVVRAEGKYLTRELELKRNKDGLKQLRDIIQETEKTKSRIPECVDLLNERVEKVHTLVVSAASTGLDILSDDTVQEDVIKEEYKKKREEEWEIFMTEMTKARADVIRKHEERMNDLEIDTKPTEL